MKMAAPIPGLAVDSCYGIMDGSDYYTAYYSFPEIEDLDLVNPNWKIE
ncbi:MAG: hypothetical protein JW999_01960 [Methanotrichaceae archaeon]|nr:hypothetical protein [Methanotrichaceae archaeon]